MWRTVGRSVRHIAGIRAIALNRTWEEVMVNGFCVWVANAKGVSVFCLGRGAGL